MWLIVTLIICNQTTENLIQALPFNVIPKVIFNMFKHTAFIKTKPVDPDTKVIGKANNVID